MKMITENKTKKQGKTTTSVSINPELKKEVERFLKSKKGKQYTSLAQFFSEWARYGLRIENNGGC